MSAQTPPLQESERDLIDRIAEALPEAIRGDYYREMSHCRVLPENDEMLRILRAMQFLTVLIEQAPGRMTSEREKMAELLSGSIETIRTTHAANVTYQKQIEQRLAKLPVEIASGIEPGAIAGKISESLRQQFQQTGIPETVAALKTASAGIGQASGEVARATRRLEDSIAQCEGSEQQAKQKAGELIGKIERAGQYADQLNAKLKANFWATAIKVLIFALGLGAGMFLAFLYRAPVLTELQQLDREIQSREARLERTPDVRKLPDGSWVVRIEKNGLMTTNDGQTYARLPRK